MAKDARFAMPVVRRTPVPAAPVFERIKAAE